MHHGLTKVRPFGVVLVATVMALVTMAEEPAKNFPFPPTMIKQPPQEQLYQVPQLEDEPHRPFILECEADGNPEPTYSWIKNGVEFDYDAKGDRISQQPGRGTLIFTQPEDADEGLYQCFAQNVHGIALSNSVFLRKSELNSFPDKNQKEIYVAEGDPLTLQCNPPTGYPRPTVFWIIQSNSGALRSLNSSRITVDPEGNLHFSYVTREDALNDAMYVCSATSFFRNEYELGNGIILEVEPTESGESRHPPTKQYTSPPNNVVLRGQRMELSCIYSGNPLPDIVWKKRGTSLSSKQFNYVNYGKTLVVKKVDFQDEGTYECTAANGIGVTQSHAMNVTVQSAPYWITASNNTIVAEGETVKFQCSAKGIPEPKLQWFVNGVALEKALPNERRKVEGNTLVLNDLVKSDTAVYQCNASNEHGYAFKNFYLNILALPPTFTERPESVIKAVATSDVVLKCRVFGVPKPTVKWLKDSQELSGNRYKVLETGDLEIKDVRMTDQGDYSCYVSNKFKDVQASWKLEIKRKTRITQTPKNFQVAVNKSATFRCNADSDPSLDIAIQWLFNGQPIDFDENPRIVQSADNSLNITKTIYLDSGEYTCIAKTELDQDTASARLTVQNKPNRPKLVSVYCSRFKAYLEWESTGDGRASILAYDIQSNTDFTPDTWEYAYRGVPDFVMRWDISISPWANYTFRVIARNKIGHSLPSEPSKRCTTSEDVPHKNPENVSGRGNRSDNLVISWTPMPLIEQNAPDFFYKLFWKRNDRESETFKTHTIVDWQTNKYVVNNQETFKPYKIKVEAHNRQGQARVAATEVIGYSGEDVPEKAPINFKLEHLLGPNSAIFSWDPVPADSIRGHFKGYKIQSWTSEKTEEQLREQVVPPNVTKTLATILKPFSTNKLRVLAFNTMYDGPPSDTLELVTPEGTPGSVAAFDAIPTFTDAFYLVWKKPIEPNGILTGYRIFYQEVIGTDLGTLLERVPQITNPNETRAKLAGLKPNTKYRLTIKASTREGLGDGHFIEAKTNIQPERPPDEPNFIWSLLPNAGGKAGVKVLWIPAIEGHPGSHFYVQYKKKGSTEWSRTPMEENQDTVEVLDLEQGTIYDMRVIAVDGEYQTASKVEEIKTAGHAPDKPHDFSRLSYAEEKADVEVTCVPTVKERNGKRFHVEYKKKGSTEWSAIPMEETLDLELGTIYDMRVGAL